jgi:hypothetical protein
MSSKKLSTLVDRIIPNAHRLEHVAAARIPTKDMAHAHAASDV